MSLALAALLAAAPAWAQPPAASPGGDKPASAPKDTAAKPQQSQPASDAAGHLPVSLDKIKEGLSQPPPMLSLRLDETPTFRVQILERQKIEELLASLFLKSTPGPFGGYVPGGGLYGYEQQRQMFPAVDNPLRQPYAAFNSGELLTILIENLAGRYLGGKALDAVSSAERARAESAAKEEVRAAVAQYCNAQPNAGAGIQICGTTIR